MNKEYITWNLYDHKVRKLVNQIEASSFRPDVVVGIMRGGMIPAIMISHHFDVPCESFKLSYRDNAVTEFGLAWSICLKYPEKNILFVDDIVDSGKTMSELQNFISSNMKSDWNSSETVPTIKYASVWFNLGQETSVNYFSVPFDRSNNKDWFVFPFEKQ
jgi:hypoxanthine phosphoribosyltransferase